jgi:hypothetical protein
LSQCPWTLYVLNLTTKFLTVEYPWKYTRVWPGLARTELYCSQIVNGAEILISLALAVSAITAKYPVAQKGTEKGNTKYKNCSDTEVLKQF